MVQAEGRASAKSWGQGSWEDGSRRSKKPGVVEETGQEKGIRDDFRDGMGTQTPQGHWKDLGFYSE